MKKSNLPTAANLLNAIDTIENILKGKRIICAIEGSKAITSACAPNAFKNPIDKRLDAAENKHSAVIKAELAKLKEVYEKELKSLGIV